MRFEFPVRIAAVGLVVGALACSSNSARTDEAGAAPRDSTGLDTAATTPNPSGYSGMERDTTGGVVQQTPVDTFLQQQGTNPSADTAGYSGIERNESASPAPSDSTVLPRDSSGVPVDSSGVTSSEIAPPSGGAMDSTGSDSTGTGVTDSASTGTIDSTSQQR